MARRIISVIGGTGQQGGSVVNALLAQGEFKVRVASRHPAGEAARALAARGVEVVQADLLDPVSLAPVFAGAYGAFIVTSFWDPTQGAREAEIGAAAVRAARKAGIEHLIWSTLPDVHTLSGGRRKVLHFTGKAKVDAVVRSAGFPRYTFVEAPFYFQNFLTALPPQPLPDGGRGWMVPMDPTKRVIHAGDINDVGRAVAAAFSAGDKLPNGSVVAVAGGVYSWNDFIGTLRALGHELGVLQVPPEAYDSLYPGAHEVREMFQYFEEHTYFGPQHEAHMAAAKALVPGGFTPFADWARTHMKPIADAPLGVRS
jgi:uncharacterized protein YbjT (DUF2867 family)